MPTAITTKSDSTQCFDVRSKACSKSIWHVVATPQDEIGDTPHHFGHANMVCPQAVPEAEKTASSRPTPLDQHRYT